MTELHIAVIAVTEGNPGPATIGVLFMDESGAVLDSFSESIGNANVDYATFYGVIRALHEAKEKYASQVGVSAYTLLLADETVKQQLNAELEITAPALVPLFMEIHNTRIGVFRDMQVTLASQDTIKKLSALINDTSVV